MDFQRNFMDALQGGYNFGQQIKQQRDQSALAQLASRAYSTPQDQQAGLLSQMAQIDPNAAINQQSVFQKQEDRVTDQLVQRARLLVAAPPEQKNGVYQQMMPELQKLGLGNLPPEYDDLVDKTANAIVQAYGGLNAANNIQSTFVDDQGNRVAVLRNGQTQILGKNNASIQVLEPEGHAPYGVVKSGGRAGEMVPIGGVVPSSGIESAPIERASNGDQVRIDPAVPAWLRQQILANPRESQSYQGAGDTGRLLVSDPINGGLMPPRTPTAAEKAYETELAKTRAQLQVAPQVAQVEADAARLKKEAEAAGERAAQAPKRIAQYQQALTAAGNVETSIDKAIKLIGTSSTGFLGARMRGIEGSDAYNLAAEIETVKANLGFDRLQQMRDNSPTGGALGAIAVQELVALQSTIANLDPNQSAEQIKANLERVKKHYAAWKDAVQKALAEERGGGETKNGAVDSLLSKYGVL